jgi:hypothetical protein
MLPTDIPCSFDLNELMLRLKSTGHSANEVVKVTSQRVVVNLARKVKNKNGLASFQKRGRKIKFEKYRFRLSVLFTYVGNAYFH